jgi:hypothetical protein
VNTGLDRAEASELLKPTPDQNFGAHRSAS